MTIMRFVCAHAFCRLLSWGYRESLRRRSLCLLRPCLALPLFVKASATLQSIALSLPSPLLTSSLKQNCLQLKDSTVLSAFLCPSIWAALMAWPECSSLTTIGSISSISLPHTSCNFEEPKEMRNASIIDCGACFWPGRGILGLLLEGRQACKQPCFVAAPAPAWRLDERACSSGLKLAFDRQNQAASFLLGLRFYSEPGCRERIHFYTCLLLHSSICSMLFGRNTLCNFSMHGKNEWQGH